MRYDKDGNFAPMSDREVVRTVRWWVLGVAAALVALSVGLWAAGVFTSGVAGRGNQVRQINDATNRTFSQEHFEGLLGDVKTYDTQIGNAEAQALQWRADHAGKPDNGLGSNATEQSRLDSIATGLRNQCASTRNQYDADARKVSVGRFRSADLPARMDDYSPQTEVDCKGAN